MTHKLAIWLSIGSVLVVVVVVGLLLFQPWLLFIDDVVDEAAEGGEVLATGEFIDAEHGTSGRAILYLREDGTRYLRLEGFETSNGPDVHVWITDQDSGGDCEGCRGSWGIYDDGDYVRLGELKGNQGDQNYEIPADADLGPMRSVVIWCDRFNVAFGTAAIA